MRCINSLELKLYLSIKKEGINPSYTTLFLIKLLPSLVYQDEMYKLYTDS